MYARIAKRSTKARRAVSDVDQCRLFAYFKTSANLTRGIISEYLFGEIVMRRFRTCGDGARMVILFLLFSETISSCVWSKFLKLPRVQFRRRRLYVSLRDRLNECYPRMSLTGASVPTFSSIYNCCPPRDFCVVEKRTLLLRLSERPGRPRFVNNSLINEFLIVL